MEVSFPIEFLVKGTPVSLQASRPTSKERWKSRVIEASNDVLPEGHFATLDRIAVTIFYFPNDVMQGDVDNIVKLILDALCKHIYMDDSQVERILIQKFEPERLYFFTTPSATLTKALGSEKPIVYIRLSTDPLEDLK